MLKTKLFFLLAIIACNLSLNAQEWTAPIKPTESDFTSKDYVADGTTPYYIYNVGCGQFVVGANNWGTEISLSNDGTPYMQVVIEPMNENEAETYPNCVKIRLNGTFVFTYTGTQRGISDTYLFRNDANGFVDRRNQSVWYWKFTPNENGNYYWQSASGMGNNQFPNSENQYAACEGAGEVIVFNSSKEHPNNEWCFIQAQSDVIELYNARVELYNSLNLAVQYNVDYQAASNVYNNPEATPHDVLLASKNLKLAIHELNIAGASKYSPVKTSFVENGTFDNDAISWISTGICDYNRLSYDKEEELFSLPFWENRDNSAFVNKMYQKIENIPNGTYKLNIAAFVNTLASPNNSQYVFANDDKVSLTSVDPTAYDVWTYVDNNTIEIGLEQTTATANWMGIDNVSLTYYGEDNLIETKDSIIASDNFIDGDKYRIYTEVNGANYYLNASGYLVEGVENAKMFTFTKIDVPGTAFTTGWNLGVQFSNPNLTNDDTGDIVNVGHIITATAVNNRNNNNRDDWERQVFFVQDGKYAVRSTNAISERWGANSYWDAFTDADMPEAGYSLTPAFIWQVEHIENVRFELYSVIKEAKTVPATDALNAEISKAEMLVEETDYDAMGVEITELRNLIELTRNTYAVSDVSLYNPIVTSFVVNGTFDNDVSGWETTGGFKNSQTDNKQEGAFTIPFWENWDPTAKRNKMYQRIENIPNGTYRLNIAAFVNTLASPNNSQYVFANNDRVYLTEGAPTAYDIWTYVTDNTIEIGLEQTTATANWMGIDNVSLTYYGEGNLKETVDSINTATSIEDGKPYRIFTEVNGKKYYLNSTGYLVDDIDASNIFSFMKVEVANTVFEKGWNLGVRFSNPTLSNDSIGDIVNVGHIITSTADNGRRSTNNRDDWERQVFFSKDGKYAVRSTNAISNRWGSNSFWDAFTDAEMPQAGYSLYPSFIWQLEQVSDCYLVNPIAQTKDGWEGTDFGTASHGVCEYWNISGAAFHQIVSLPVGTYKLTATAFTRTGMHGTLYAGDYSMDIATVDKSVVNSREEAAAWFAEGNGKNELTFTLYDDADIEVGLKADSTTADYWLAWSGFNLERIASGPLYSLHYLVDGDTLRTKSLAEGWEIQPIDAPKKDGCTFICWDGLPDVMPNHDLNVVAKYEFNRYQLTYMVDGIKISTDSVSYTTELTPLSEPAKEGYTFSGWSEIPDSMPAHDVTISGSFHINKYLLTYVVDGEMVKADSVTFASKPEQYAEPTKKGYTFSGWSEKLDSMPARDVTITGSFHINKYLLTYVVDGETVKADSVTYAAALTPREEPTKEGYTFGGWSYIPATMPANDVTVTGSFRINKYFVTYLVDGEVLRSDSVTYGQSIPSPEVPERYGYVFNRWIEMPSDGNMPARDLTLTAYYSPSEVETDGSKFVYSDDVEGYEFVSTVSEESTEVVIPEVLEDIPVVYVPEGAFVEQTQLQVLTWENPVPVAAECFATPEEHGNLLVFTADTAKVTYTGNVVKGNVANHVKLYDGRPMTNPQPFIAQSISITKEFSKETIIGSTSGWETIVVPFDVDSITMEDGSLIAPFGSDVATTRYFWLAKMDATDGFIRVTQIHANIPYIISMPNSKRYEEEYRISGKVTFHGTNVEVQPTANAVSQSGPQFGIVPTYQEVAASDSVYVLNDEPYEADGITWPAGSIFVRSSRAARPFEAYTYANASSTGHVKGYIPLDKMSTGIEGIKQWSMTNGSGAVYDLSGRKIVNGKPTLRKGIYIKDGHKVLVK